MNTNINVIEIEEYLKNRITRCYQEEKDNYDKDFGGKFISCEISGKYLLITYEEYGKTKVCKICEPEFLSLEQIYYFWQVDSFEQSKSC